MAQMKDGSVHGDQKQQLRYFAVSNIPEGSILGTDGWEVQVRPTVYEGAVVFTHRDSESSILLREQEATVGSIIHVEVFAEAEANDSCWDTPDESNDVLLRQFDACSWGEAVWLADYWARDLHTEWGCDE